MSRFEHLPLIFLSISFGEQQACSSLCRKAVCFVPHTYSVLAPYCLPDGRFFFSNDFLPRTSPQRLMRSFRGIRDHHGSASVASLVQILQFTGSLSYLFLRVFGQTSLFLCSLRHHAANDEAMGSPVINYDEDRK